MDSTLAESVVIVVVLFAAFRLLPRLMAGAPFDDPLKVHQNMQEDSNAIMIDVRTSDEFNSGHVTDSINVQPHELGEDLESKKPYMNQKVYVICLSSQRSGMAARKLKGFGFKNISVVKGGFLKWKKLNLPIS